MKKHHIKAIIELDVTDSRIKLKKIRSETGEHISFTSWIIKRICKYWLKPIVLSKNYGFTSNELRKIKKIIEENVIKIMEAWYEHCGESK